METLAGPHRVWAGTDNFAHASQARNMKHVIALLEKALPPDAIPPPAAAPAVFPLHSDK